MKKKHILIVHCDADEQQRELAHMAAHTFREISGNCATYTHCARQSQLASADGALSIETPDSDWTPRRFGFPLVRAIVGCTSQTGNAICADPSAVGVLVASHLQAQLFNRLAFLSFHPAADDGIIEAAADWAGEFTLPRFAPSTSCREKALDRWLELLPPRSGLICATDHLARLACSGLHRVRRKVPEDVAVIGIGNHPVAWQTNGVSISSIDLDARRIVMDASEQLWRLITGQERQIRTVTTPPRGVIVRKSTDCPHSHDMILADAMDIVRTKSRHGLQVPELCRLVGVGRRCLERRFRQILHPTVDAEIRLVRVKHARRLLADTDLPLACVAKESGFADVYYFSTAFKREIGLAPKDFRDLANDSRPLVRSQDPQPTHA